MRKIFVFDTNSLISAALFSFSTPRRALDKALDVGGSLAMSDKTLEEFVEVLF